MDACLLCLEKTTDPIKVFSKEGQELHIDKIITTHFWLKPNHEKGSEDSVCLICWKSVQDFHQFYQHVAEVHNYLESKDFSLNMSNPGTSIDPFPSNLKSDEINTTENVLNNDSFDPEIKFEVNDLEFLPQIEIIESNTTISERTLRATRRSRQRTGKNNGSTSVSNKNIKRERGSCSENDSEPELPLSMLLQTDFKTDSQTNSLFEVDNIKLSLSSKPSNTTTERKRRGRPRKIKILESDEKADDERDSCNTTKFDVDVKMEDSSEREFPMANHCSGTEDSASSSSENEDSNSDSLPDFEPIERYADIPKRVVVKPKKYRKREKPLVPPKRMSKEALEKKRMQQEEFDHIIAQFFKKLSCPKCNLLVQNFGDMRRHFSASHQDNKGYMECCGRKFHLRKALAEHVLVHWNPEHFKCKTCNKVLQDSRTLEIHEISHNADCGEAKEKKLFQCDKCSRGFTTKAALEHHLFSKHVPKSEFQFACTECKKKLPTERKLKDHIKYAHDPETAVICEKCGKQMRNSYTLKKHVQLEHSDQPRPVPAPVQCEICGTWLRHLAGLRQHMKSIHEESVGEHRCHICNKTSVNSRALRRHIYLNHECERKFKCTMCEKAFKRPQDLREHTSVHTGEVLYTCPNCPMTFFSNANMYKHRQRLHRAEWEAGRKKPMPPNIMRQAIGATAEMKVKQAIGSSSAFFAQNLDKQISLEVRLDSNKSNCQ